jgi:NhaP-type Na+/H+ or K+/H+ antiporter
MTALYIAGIGLCALLAQWLAWVVRVPAILFLLLTGLLLGPGFSVIDPDAIFGDLLFPIISLSVAIILRRTHTALQRIKRHWQCG